MGLKDALLGIGAVTALAVGTGSSISFFEESLPNTLNPLFATSMVDHRSQELVFDRMWFHDAITNELQSRLVDSYQLTKSGRAVKINLKSGLKWHDGKPVTSKDVCFTVKAILNRKTSSPIASEYRQFISGCETQGNLSAEIEFTRVFHNPRERLGFALLPEHEFDSTAVTPDLEFSIHPTGTGPFKGSKGTRGVIFDAFSNLHHTPSLAQLQLREGNDPLIQVRTIINNGVHGIIAVPPGNRPELSVSDEVALKSYDLRSWWFIAVNTSKPALNKKKVRQALNLLLDRTELREFATGVRAGEQNSPCEFISGPFVQSSPYYNRGILTIDRSDRAQAQKLLKEAGLTKIGGRWHDGDQPITLRIGMKAPLDNEAKDLMSQVGNQLDQGGFARQEYKISVDDWNRTIITGKGTDYDLVIGKWSFGIVEDVNHLFHTRSSNEGKWNIFNYSNREVDSLLTQFDKAITDTAAQDAYHSLHELLADELPYIFLWKLDTKSGWRTEVRGNIIAPYHYFTEIDSWKYKK